MVREKVPLGRTITRLCNLAMIFISRESMKRIKVGLRSLLLQSETHVEDT